jgi:hypothetical protein
MIPRSLLKRLLKHMSAGVAAALFGALLLAQPGGTANATVLVSGNPSGSLHIQSIGLSVFRGILETATGNDLAFANDLTNGAQVAAADALFISLPDAGPSSLTAPEQTNISTFIATGKRVFFMGEHAGWVTWNDSFLPLVSGTSGANVDGVTTPVVAHQLTAGVSSVEVYTGGSASGGTSLFDLAFANLWGASQSVLTVQEINLFSNQRIGELDNAVFATNVADWLAGNDPERIAAPGALTLFILGIAAIGLVRRQRAA